jgi:hypothetical protein
MMLAFLKFPPNLLSRCVPDDLVVDQTKTKPFARHTLLYAMTGSVYLHRCSGRPGSGIAYFYSHPKARILHSHVIINYLESQGS